MKENQTKKFEKRSKDYIDIAFAGLHFFIIIFPLLLVWEFIALTIIGCIFAVVFLTFILYTFIKNNPFFIYYGYGLFFCAFLFLMVSLLIVPLIGFLIIPVLIYFYILVKFKRPFETVEGYMAMKSQVGFRHRRLGGRIPFGLSGASDIISLEEKSKIEKRKENFNKEYSVKRIRGIAAVLTASLLVIYIILVNII